MKCQNLISGKNRKNISICHLLKILPRVLSVKNGFILTKEVPLLPQILNDWHILSFFFRIRFPGKENNYWDICIICN